VELERLPRDSAGTHLMVQACRVSVLINRACAVFGGTYVLGKESIPETMEIEEGTEYPVKLKIPCHSRTISAKHLIASSDHLPQQLRRSAAGNKDRQTAHCVALLPALPTQLRRQEKAQTDSDGTDGDEDEEAQDDTAVIVFPPSGDQGLVRALVMGEGTGSCPAGQCKCN
jgi:RAB protein geranylgeranyltransferase component A